jgi:hypothetical protein
VVANLHYDYVGGNPHVLIKFMSLLFEFYFLINVEMCCVELYNMMHPKLLDGFNCESKGEDNGRKRSWVRSLARNTLGVKGHVGAPRWD